MRACWDIWMEYSVVGFTTAEWRREDGIPKLSMEWLWRERSVGGCGGGR